MTCLYDNALSETEIIDILLKGKNNLMSDVEKMMYNTNWNDIVAAVEKNYDVKSTKITDSIPILERLSLDGKFYKQKGVFYLFDEQKEEGPCLDFKERMHTEANKLIERSMLSYLFFNDFDIMHGKHPYATPDQNEQLKRGMIDFIKSINLAKENGAEILVFVNKINETTKTNLYNAFSSGLSPVYFPMEDSAQIRKANFHITYPADEKQRKESIKASFVNLKSYISRLVENEVSLRSLDKKNVEKNIINKMSDSCIIEKEKLDKIYNDLDNLNEEDLEKYKLSMKQILNIESFLSSYYKNISILPVKRLDNYVRLLKRDYAEVDVKNNRVIDGIPELNYKYGKFVITNFPPLITAIETHYDDITRNLKPAWKEDWGKIPEKDNNFLENIDKYIALS